MANFNKGKNVKSKFRNLRIRGLATLGLAALVALLASTAANATTLTYDFTVTATSGPLNGTVSHGTFSFDSSSITPGATNNATGLLTGIDFTWNGTTYNTVSASVNDQWLGFDSAGQLNSFVIGNACAFNQCPVVWGYDNWFAAPGTDGFGYSLTGENDFWTGNVTFSPAGASVPEPAMLGMFGLGLLLIGGFVGARRRMAQ